MSDWTASLQVASSIKHICEPNYTDGKYSTTFYNRGYLINHGQTRVKHYSQIPDWCWWCYLSIIQFKCNTVQTRNRSPWAGDKIFFFNWIELQFVEEQSKVSNAALKSSVIRRTAYCLSIADKISLFTRRRADLVSEWKQSSYLYLTDAQISNLQWMAIALARAS